MVDEGLGRFTLDLGPSMADNCAESLGASFELCGDSGQGFSRLFGRKVALLFYEDAAEQGLEEHVVGLVVEGVPGRVSTG